MTKQVITTNDVAIKQVEVSIKVLKIGNKQVTQAVFKQLPEEPVIHPDTGALQGEAWGRVNYHVGCDDIGPKHFHVVWQKGDGLRRCIVALPWECWGSGSKVSEKWANLMNRRYRHAEAYLAARLLEGYDPGGDAPFKCNVTIGQACLTLDLGGTIRNAWWVTGFNGVRRLTEGSQANLKRFISDVYSIPTLESKEIEDRFIALDSQLTILRQEWQRSYDQLQQLDQLFIAV